MDGIQDTGANLEAAIAGEKYEFTELYPGFLSTAEGEGNKRAEISFRNALGVEEIHHGLYSGALAAVKDGNDIAETAIHVCEICGNTVYGAFQDPCAVCKAPAAKFMEIE